MIALLSNVTTGSLHLRLEKALNEPVYTPDGFDTWRSELLNPDSPLWQNEPGTVFVLLHARALFSGKESSWNEDSLFEILQLLDQARADHQERLFVVSSLDLASSPFTPLTASNIAARLCSLWREELEKRGLPILDIEELVTEHGRVNFYNAKTWFLGSLPFSQQGEKILVEECLRIESAIRGKRKKCLVLDLDNTLWGGVIGEDGISGISLASHGMGSQYRDFQLALKALSAQGVLLTIASKNNEEDALLPFREHPCTVLKEEDFVCIKANWDPKFMNIAAIAKELNIGLDSLVFIDDNPVERESVKSALPEVIVPDFPTDSSLLPAFGAWIARRYFTALRIGHEDLQKTKMYQAESQREASRSAYLSLDDYLKSLDMKMDIHRLLPDEVGRAAQLTQKTNQFNLTTRRYSESDLLTLLKQPHTRIWMADLKDRFGEYGKICLVIVKIKEENKIQKAFFDTFLMSCRVMGRGVEATVLSIVEQELAKEGVQHFYGEYIPTAKNTPVKDFWSKMGYTSEEKLWVLNPPFQERRSFVCPDY